MKNFVKVIMVVALMAALICVSMHIVKVESIYTYDNGLFNVLTGRTLGHLRTIETKLISGEVINDGIENIKSVPLEMTGRMLASNGHHTVISFELR